MKSRPQPPSSTQARSFSKEGKRTLPVVPSHVLRQAKDVARSQGLSMHHDELRAQLVRKAMEEGDAVKLKAAMELSDTYLKSAIKMAEEAENNG